MPKGSNWLDARTKAVAVAFLTTLRDGVVHLTGQPWVDVQRDIEALAQSLVAGNAHRVIDEPSAFHLVRSSLLLSAYRILTPLIDDRTLLLDGLYNALYDELKKEVEAYLVERFDISPAAPEEAFDKASVNFKKIGDEKFGRAFIYEQEVQDEIQNITVVRRCFFNDFFRANDALEVLPLLCAQDDLWMKELNKSKYGIKAFRTALLSRRDDVCRFHFTRMNPPIAERAR